MGSAKFVWAFLASAAFFGGFNTAQAAILKCASHRNAPVRASMNGQWLLSAEVRSEYTLHKLSFKNRSFEEAGGNMKKPVSYDRSITDVRSFITQDVDCKYSVDLPRGFIAMKSFQATLNMSCDSMFDARAVLYCTVR